MSIEKLNKSSAPKIRKYYFNGEDSPPIHYRAGTSDQTIINSILVNQQEYFFPHRQNFEPEMIFDIGANIGVLSVVFAHIYPMAEIHAFEPEKSNFELLQMNTKPYPQIKVHNVGLGAKTETRKLWPSSDPTNLGGFSNFIQVPDLEPVDCEILATKTAVERFGVPDLIKIDCEGAENEILINFPNLERVSFIAGELHSQAKEYLMLHALSYNFKLALRRNFDDKTWHFHAVNKDWKDFGLVAPQPTKENGLDAPKESPQTGDSKPT